MTLLLDTHFLIWILTDSIRLRKHPWLKHHQPWGLSPVSLLEMQFLAEVGRLELNATRFMDLLLDDRRFLLDEPPLQRIVEHALTLGWTRDPFDRLLCAHSLCRRVPLCSVDIDIQASHRLMPAELTP